VIGGIIVVIFIVLILTMLVLVKRRRKNVKIVIEEPVNGTHSKEQGLEQVQRLL